MTPKQAVLNRRLLCVGISVVFLYGATGAEAGDARGLGGTWGGSQNGLTAQVIIVGASVIGFFWRGDYLDAEGAKFSEDRRTLSFGFRSGKATLKRTGDRTATITVTEEGNGMRLDLHCD
jgi:hypothetical protein